MNLKAIEKALCLFLAPVHVGLAVTLAHPDLDRPECGGSFYVAAGLWVFAAVTLYRRKWRFWRLFALPLGVLLLVHLVCNGVFSDAAAATVETLTPAKNVTTVFGIPAPRAAPELLPMFSAKQLAATTVAAVTGVTTWVVRIVIGTPGLAWVATMIAALVFNQRKE